ncbi:hypothetical protein CL614_05240 [archaeon]|nr:hypothetical protein [archaeon]|tara:strand:- start:1866 stop:2456 length:591 start_codon:yes stop_codon:yes gene_type:complete
MDINEYIESKPDPWDLKKIGKNPKLTKLLEKEIGIAGKIIDIGGGNGFYAHAMHELGNKVTVLDQSKKMLAEGRKMFPELKFIHASATTMPFAAATFNAAITMGTLMYIQNKDAFFKEVHRILKPNSRFVLYERNKSDPLNKIVTLFKKTEQSPDNRDMFLKKTEIRQLAEKHGFKVEKIRGSGKTFLTAILIRNP